MKIHVIGGVAESLTNFRSELLSEMVSRGHQVLASAGKARPETLERIGSLGVKWIPIDINPTGLNIKKDYKLVMSLMEMFSREKPDCILTYTVKPVIYGSIAARKMKIDHYAWITGLGYGFQGKSIKRRMISLGIKQLYKKALRTNKVVFFQNMDDMEQLKSQGVLNRRAETVIVPGSGVNLDHYKPTDQPKGEVTFLMMTRLVKDKGVEEYCEAAKVLKVRYSKVKFILLGGKYPGTNEIDQKLIRKWKIENAVELIDWNEDVRPFLRACHVYVLPSHREGTPRSVLEAMSTGRAIITTDAPGCKETVYHGYNGLIVPVGNAAALSRAMEYFIIEKNAIKEMGKNSLSIAREKYDVKIVNRILMEQMRL